MFGDDEEEEEEEKEEGIELQESMKYKHEDVWYFKTPYGGYDSVLFTYPEGDLVGHLQEDGEIEMLQMESDDEDE